MGHGKREESHNVYHQGKNKLNSMYRYGKGTSKYKDKLANASQGKGYIPASDKIYINSTFEDYKKAWADFCCEMKNDGYKVDGHVPHTLDETVGFVPKYIDILKNREGRHGKYSAWTIRTYFAGVGKVLGISARDYNLPKRRRRDITRSRGHAVRDDHFSKKNNADLIEFCRCTGLRNASELQKINGNCLVYDQNGNPCIYVIGKGKKARTSPIIGTEEEIERVVNRIKNAAEKPVWPHVPSCADIHDMRAEYAQKLYNDLARDAAEIPQKERYCCRGDQKGKWYDRKAVLEVSKALGHSRANVVVEHYLGRH